MRVSRKFIFLGWFRQKEKNNKKTKKKTWFREIKLNSTISYTANDQLIASQLKSPHILPLSCCQR